MKKIYGLVVGLLTFFHLEAQWTLVYETTETNFYTIYALDKERVFLGSELPAVHSSQDGGSSFDLSELQEHGFVYSIAFEDQNIGYAGGGCYFPFDGCPGNTFYKTVDGGATWDTLLSNMNIGVFVEIAALGGGNIFAVSDYGGMYRSVNGGLGWQSVIIQNTTFPVFGHVQFLDAQRGFVVTRTILSSSSAIQRVHYTADSGANWTTIFEIENFSNYILDFHFTDAQHGFLAVPGGKLLQTSNGGTDWTELSYGDADESARDLFFADANTAYLSSFQQPSNRSRLYRSTDGGTTWAVDLESDSVFYNQLYFVDAENGWLMGDYRKLLRRTGANAVDVATPPAPWLLYPNPAGDYFVLRNAAQEAGHVLCLSDAQGRSLKTMPLASGDNYMPVGEHSPGLYFLRVLDGKGQVAWSGKLVKGQCD